MPNPHLDVVLLTANLVAPEDARNLARRDSALRLQDGLEAYDFNLGQLANGAFEALVLCDNSGHDPSAFAARADAADMADRIELIAHYGRDYPARHGRYKIRKLARLRERQPLHADLYCHCRNHPSSWLDMCLLRWNQRAYHGLIRGACQWLCQDASPTSAEQRFRVPIGSHRSRMRVMRRFAHVPRVDGVRGFGNRADGGLWRQHVAHGMAHRPAPWVWI